MGRWLGCAVLSAWQPDSLADRSALAGAGSLVVTVVFSTAAIAVMVLDRYIPMRGMRLPSARRHCSPGGSCRMAVHQERRVIELRRSRTAD